GELRLRRRFRPLHRPEHRHADLPVSWVPKRRPGPDQPAVLKTGPGAGRLPGRLPKFLLQRVFCGVGRVANRPTCLRLPLKRTTTMRVRYLSRGLVAVALALSGAGCSDKVRVKGVVTLDGNPVQGATVTFIPDGRSGQSATGITQEDGSFRLTTLKENDGAN